MAQNINTNVTSLFAQQALTKSKWGLEKAMERLSSGLRINSAKDDATGLAIASGYDATVRGAAQAARNALDGISTAQIQDGIHSQVQENLQRIREIAVQLGGTASGSEYTQLAAENTRLLGLAANSGTTVNNANGSTYTGVGTKASLGGTATVAGVDADLLLVTTARASYGADIAALQSAVTNLGNQQVNTAAAYSRIMDADYAVETTQMTRNSILQQAGTAVLAQANQLPNSVVGLLR